LLIDDIHILDDWVDSDIRLGHTDPDLRIRMTRDRSYHNSWLWIRRDSYHRWLRPRHLTPSLHFRTREQQPVSTSELTEPIHQFIGKQPPQSLLTSLKGVALGLPHDAGISIDSFKSAPSIHTQDRNPSWDILAGCAGRHHNRIAAGRSKGAVASRLSARVLPCLNGVRAQGLPRGPSHSFALRAPGTESSTCVALQVLEHHAPCYSSTLLFWACLPRPWRRTTQPATIPTATLQTRNMSCAIRMRPAGRHAAPRIGSV
jgi:hypothetical protein